MNDSKKIYDSLVAEGIRDKVMSRNIYQHNCFCYGRPIIEEIFICHNLYGFTIDEINLMRTYNDMLSKSNSEDSPLIPLYNKVGVALKRLTSGKRETILPNDAEGETLLNKFEKFFNFSQGKSIQPLISIIEQLLPNDAVLNDLRKYQKEFEEISKRI